MTTNVNVDESVRLDIVVTNDDGSVRNITGATATFIIYDEPRGNAVMTGSAAVTDGTAGEVTATLSSSQNTYTAYAVLWAVVTLTETDLTKTVIFSDKLVVS